MLSTNNVLLVLAVVALGAPPFLQPSFKNDRSDRLPVIAATCSETAIVTVPERNLTIVEKTIEGCPKDQAALAEAIRLKIVEPNAKPDHR